MRDALAHIDQVTEEKKSAQAREFNEKGIFNLLEARPQAALGYFKCAAELDPSNPKYFVNKGVTCQLLGDQDGMLRAFRAAIGLGWEDPFLLNAVAWHYVTQPQYNLLETGIAYAETAVEKVWHPAYLDTLACANAARGNYKLAALLEREALSLAEDRDPCKAYYARMLAAFQDGQSYTEAMGK